MKSTRSLYLLLGLAIFSCKKNDTSENTYTSVYHKSGLNVISNFRLFCSSGEIRDPSIISKFNQLDSTNFRFYADGIRNGQYGMDSVFLLDPQHAVIKDYGVQKNCLTNQRGSRLTLTTVDTITGYSSIDEFTRTPNYYLGQVKPEVFTEYVISSTRGAYIFGFTARETFVFERSGGQLTAPIIMFMNHRQSQQNLSSVNNLLQEDFYKNMVAGDTLSLIMFQLLYEK